MMLAIVLLLWNKLNTDDSQLEKDRFVTLVVGFLMLTSLIAAIRLDFALIRLIDRL